MSEPETTEHSGPGIPDPGPGAADAPAGERGGGAAAEERGGAKAGGGARASGGAAEDAESDGDTVANGSGTRERAGLENRTAMRDSGPGEGGEPDGGAAAAESGAGTAVGSDAAAGPDAMVDPDAAGSSGATAASGTATGLDPADGSGAAAGPADGSGAAAGPADGSGAAAGPDPTVRTGATADSDATAGSGAAEGSGAAGDPGGDRMSEAEAELAAQQVERERIERRKAAKKGPIESGGKLSGKAAGLLAAVRAVESGEKPAVGVLAEPETVPRRVAPEPVRRPGHASVEAATAPAAPAPGSVRGVRLVLSEGGAPETLAPQVAAALGEGAEERLRADPWQLLRVRGVRPEQADGFARALLGAECRPDDERRGRALTVWLLEQAALAGHTALDAAALTAALVQRAVPDPESALHSTLAEGEALAFQDTQEADGEGERPVRVLVGLERYALAEESLADGLARLIGSVPEESGPSEDWERAAASAQDSAAELLRAVAGHGLVLHTGGEASRVEPARLLGEARRLGLRAWAAAHSPLGRDGFAELLRQFQEAVGPSGTPAPAVATVAGLLSGAEGPGRDEDGSLALDLLVVLDAPQLDVESAALLVESLPDGARLVLAGDPGVLWSVGPGRVFADLLAARVCPQFASRVPDPGPLGELVSGIGVGELGEVAAPGKEVVIVPVRDAGEAVHRTVQLVADSVPRAIGVPVEQTTVITPGHGGAAGTRALNAALKARLNPGPGRFGGFDPGDRVVHSPAPGRALSGHVVKADAEGLHLSCSGAPVVVPRERVETQVRHGWALTAHQAVGGRWPAVVVVLPGDAARALSRPWVYTAFGRASRHLSVVHGVEQALSKAVAEVSAKPRTTRLPDLLRTQARAAEERAAG